MRRLRDHGLVEKRGVPGSRRDYYRAVPDIFGRAFANHAALLHSNLELARKFAPAARQNGREPDPHFIARIEEMERFYELMNGHLESFLEQWRREWEERWQPRLQTDRAAPTPTRTGESS